VTENILKVRKTGFTLVPEAGTDRLRRVINKQLDNQDILDAAATAFGRGWRLLKLYFMIGLPTEKQEDLEGIVRLVEEIYGLGKNLMKTAPRINLSLSSFIPKPHTPFQWLSMEEEKTLGEKQRFIRSRLSRFRSIAIKTHPTRSSVLEAVFSRGDRRLGPAVVQAWKSGARFDSWRDRFDFARWAEAFSNQGIDCRTYLGPLEKDAVLPWDHIETGIKKKFLLSELDKAFGEERTASCLDSDCGRCQGCDYSVRPRKAWPSAARPRAVKTASFGKKMGQALRYEAFYEKSGLARFISHRDLTNHLQRSLRRAGVEVAHSAGFHPKMLVSYAPALPLGMEAREDCFEFRSFYRFDEKALLRRLNRSVRQGIRFLRVRRVGDSETSLNERIKSMVYSLDLKDETVREALAAKKTGAGEYETGDLDFVQSELARLIKEHPGLLIGSKVDGVEMKLYLELPVLSRRGLRPQDVVNAVLGLENASAHLTRERFVFQPDPGRPSSD
jgi:radical SAM-linked protein